MARPTRKRPRAIDLFSGCGGMSVGLKRAGFEVIGAVEVDELAVRTYKLNHKGVHVWQKDIRGISGRALKRKLQLRQGELDLLAGCPPCQGFSRLRTLNRVGSVADDRNDLIYEFLRLVHELRPKAVLLENVPGLKDDARFREFIASLTELGYATKHAVLDAARYGVPQRRERLIVLSSEGTAIPFLREAKGIRTVRDTIGELPRAGKSGDPAHDVSEQRSPRIVKMIAKIPKDGGSRRDLPPAYRLGCHARCDGFYDVYGRMRWKDVSPTITSGFVNPSKGRFLHPTANRTLTLREGALLQTFPKDYKFPIEAGKYPVAEMIGNAIPPEFIFRQATYIRRHLAVLGSP